MLRPTFEQGVRIENFSTPKILRRVSSNAKKFHEAKTKTKNPSRRPQAFQNHRERQNQTHALRQAPSHGHKSAGPHAQAKKADAGQSQRRSRRQTNASLRLKAVKFLARACTM